MYYRATTLKIPSQRNKTTTDVHIPIHALVNFWEFGKDLFTQNSPLAKKPFKNPFFWNFQMVFWRAVNFVWTDLYQTLRNEQAHVWVCARRWLFCFVDLVFSEWSPYCTSTTHSAIRASLSWLPKFVCWPLRRWCGPSPRWTACWIVVLDLI